MTELKFVVELEEDAFIATALGESIVTQAGSHKELLNNVRDAVRVHFGDSPSIPETIHIHYIGDEIIQLEEEARSGEFPAKNTVLKYEDPFEPACPAEEWETMR